jgi:hypothetical protein
MSQESLDYVPDFTVRREEFVLHNAGPDKIDAMWAGHPFTIPGCDEIHPTNPAQFEDGSPIPGTVILRDDYMALPGGSMPQPGSPYNWRASVAIKNVLGIDKHTGKAISSYSKKGVSYLRMPRSSGARLR